MLRKLLGTGLLLATLAACTEFQGRTCNPENDDCGEGAACVDGYCVVQVKPPPVDPTLCTPACAEYQQCARVGAAIECRPRYTGLDITTPSEGAVLGGGTIPVTAQLAVQYEPDGGLPDLVFSATLSDGGVAGSFTDGGRNGNTYTAQWTVPSVDDQIALRVAYPDPAAALSDVVNVRVDTQAPVFTFAFSEPSQRLGGSDTQAEQRDLGFEGAYKRDESVTVTISANEPVSNVALTVIGIGADGNPGAALPPVPVQPGGTCLDNPSFCGSTVVNLSVPEMKAFRGTMGLRVEGQDSAGNLGVANSGVRVTRLKWRYEIQGINIVQAAPAIGNTGDLYIGTTNAGFDNGQMIALSPSGARKWVGSQMGAIRASPVVGELKADGVEYVYAGLRNSTGSQATKRGFYHGGTGAFSSVCDDQASLNQVEAALSLNRIPASDGGVAEEAHGVINTATVGTLFAMRADRLGGTASQRCPDEDLEGRVVYPGNTLNVGGVTVVAYPTATSAKLQGYVLGSNNIWNQSFSVDSSAMGEPRSMAFSNGEILGGTNVSAVFGGPLDGGAVVSRASAPAPTLNPSVGQQDGGTQLAVGLDSAQGRLLVVELQDGGTSLIPTGNNKSQGAPVWGRGGYLYAATDGNQLQVLKLPEGLVWTFDTAAPVSASMNMDCSRLQDGGVAQGLPGVLYAATTLGNVLAVIVDSPGLDPNAPWPKYQHDARNTGNPATPITNCP